MSISDQCQGKERYLSPALAHKAAKRRRATGHNIDVYRCRHCDGYHHGSRIRTVDKRLKRTMAKAREPVII